MKKPTIHIGADHAGFSLKEQLKRTLEHEGFQVQDLSPRFVEDDDYPKHAFAVARSVAKDAQSRGILVCGSGIGMAMAANRIKGARAFEAFDLKGASLAREHTDANIITLSGWRMSLSVAKKLIDTFLKVKASNAERHRRRVTQLG